MQNKPLLKERKGRFTIEQNCPTSSNEVNSVFEEKNIKRGRFTFRKISPLKDNIFDMSKLTKDKRSTTHLGNENLKETLEVTCFVKYKYHWIHFPSSKGNDEQKFSEEKFIQNSYFSPNLEDKQCLFFLENSFSKLDKKESQSNYLYEHGSYSLEKENRVLYESTKDTKDKTHDTKEENNYFNLNSSFTPILATKVQNQIFFRSNNNAKKEHLQYLIKSPKQIKDKIKHHNHEDQNYLYNNKINYIQKVEYFSIFPLGTNIKEFAQSKNDTKKKIFHKENIESFNLHKMSQ